MVIAVGNDFRERSAGAFIENVEEKEEKQFVTFSCITDNKEELRSYNLEQHVYKIPHCIGLKIVVPKLLSKLN